MNGTQPLNIHNVNQCFWQGPTNSDVLRLRQFLQIKKRIEMVDLYG